MGFMFHTHMTQSEDQFVGFKWTDIINPTKKVLEQLAEELRLPKKLLINCLDPDYLPHVENYGTTQFIVLRLMEPKPQITADTVQEITTKIVLFVTADKIISIHRLPLKEEMTHVREKLKSQPSEEVSKHHVIALFFDQISIGFDSPIAELERKMEIFEEKIFHSERAKSTLLEGYYIKRQASAFKKVLRFTIEVQNKLMQKMDTPAGQMQEIRDRFERNLFYADDVFENVQSLLNLHLAMASQRTNEASLKTNEIVRVLTVLTIFFSPLNFLAGVYGMNFEHIPLLQHVWGFWFALLFMVIVAGGLLLYVLRKGWLRAPPTD